MQDSSLGRNLAVAALAALVLVALIVGGLFVFNARTPQVGPSPVVEGELADAVPGTPAASEGGTEGTTPGAGSSDGEADADEATEAAAEDEPQGPIAIQGRVLDVDDEGIASARIVAIPNSQWSDFLGTLQSRFSGAGANPFTMVRELRGEFEREVEKLPRTESDVDGNYVFRALGPGEYRLLTSHDDFLASLETWVIVAPEQPASADIRLARGYAISGKVVDPQGAAVAGARITSEVTGTGGQKGFMKMFGFMMDAVEGRLALGALGAESGEDGSFRLPSLEPVAYDLTVRKAGFAARRLPKVPAGASAVLVSLDRGRLVRGRVLDSDGEPLPATKVELAPRMPTEINNPMVMFQADFDLFGERRVEVATGDEGRFEITGLEAGQFVLAVNVEEYPPFKQPVDVEKVDIDLGDLTLEDPLIIAGVVVSDVGQAVADARVEATRLAKDGREVPQVNPFARAEQGEVEALTDVEGRFALTGLSSGDYRLAVRAEDYAVKNLAAVTAGERQVRITLQRGVSIVGRVLSADDRTPIEDATVTAPMVQKSVQSDVDGRFEMRGLSADAGDGPVRQGLFLQARHRDFAMNYQQVSVDPGVTTKEVELLLKPFEQLVGWVVDIHGDPIAGARVRMEVPGMPEIALMFGPSGPTSYAIFSAEDGSFEMQKPSGEFGPGRGMGLNVIATHPRYAPGRVSVQDLPADQGVEVVLDAGTTLTGRVTDAAGQGVTGAVIRIRKTVKLEGEAMIFRQLFPQSAGKSHYSGADGSYRMTRLEAGEYDVEVVALGFARKFVEGLLVQGEEVRRDFILDAGGTIDGRVVDVDGAPLAGVEVVAVLDVDDPAAGGNDEMRAAMREMMLLADQGIAQTRTGGEGRFEIKNLPEGMYSLIARRQGYQALKTDVFRLGETVGELVLERLSSLAGRVLDAVTLRPVQRFQVSAMPLRDNNQPDYSMAGMRSPAKFNNSDGTFVYEGMRSGRYSIEIQQADYVPHSEIVRVGGSDNVDLEVLLVPGTRVQGVVINELTGEPIVGVNVTFHKVNKDPEQSRVQTFFGGSTPRGASVEDGSFSVGGLGEGEYHVNVNHQDYYLAEGTATQVQIPGDEARELQFNLRPAGRLEGSVANLPSAEGFRENFMLRLEMVEDPEQTDSSVVESADAETGEQLATKATRPRHVQSAWVNPNDGSFNAASLRPGIYKISLEHRRYPRGGEGPVHGDINEKLPLGEVEINAGRTEILRTSYR